MHIYVSTMSSQGFNIDEDTVFDFRKITNNEGSNGLLPSIPHVAENEDNAWEIIIS